MLLILTYPPQRFAFFVLAIFMIAILYGLWYLVGDETEDDS